MSDMVERTLTALPGLFLQNQLGGPAASRTPFFSRLGGLIRGVTALSSKHVCGGVGWAGWGGAAGPETSVCWMDAAPRPPQAACTDLREASFLIWRPEDPPCVFSWGALRIT